jgi:flagellar motor switch protein FliN/FliY
VASDNDDVLDPAEIEALLHSAAGGPQAAGASPAAPHGGPTAASAAAGQPLSSSQAATLLGEKSAAGASAAGPEALLERASADLAAAVAPDIDSPGRGVDLAAARPYDLQAFDQAPADGVAGALSNLKDVELDLRIELGRTELLIEDVLKLREGSVVALDKLAGDPVDVLVNGRLVARGEVLVLNDNFCVRIAEILAPAQV